MVCRIHNGLRTLTEQFCKKVTTTRAGKEFIFPRDGPSSRVEMSYEYLMAWFAFHCPVLIQPGEKAPEGVRFAHLCLFENSRGKANIWQGSEDWLNVRIRIVCSGASHISQASNTARSFEMLDTIALH